MINKGSVKKLIILDRDGVINHDSDDYIKSPDEWVPIPGSLQAIARLNKAGYKVAIASNQSGIARGYYSLETLSQMHQKMDNLLAEVGGRIDYIAFCPHGPDDGCACRKPKPGMLLEIAKNYSIEPEFVTFVGDTASDKKAAEAANMHFVLVKTGKGKTTLASKNHNSDCCVHDSLEAFVDSKLLEVP
jgi:D-glycero-D-manno-heptose 1,7-bisphosphate phosphatase